MGAAPVQGRTGPCDWSARRRSDARSKALAAVGVFAMGGVDSVPAGGVDRGMGSEGRVRQAQALGSSTPMACALGLIASSAGELRHCQGRCRSRAGGTRFVHSLGAEPEGVCMAQSAAIARGFAAERRAFGSHLANGSSVALAAPSSGQLESNWASGGRRRRHHQFTTSVHSLGCSPSLWGSARCKRCPIARFREWAQARRIGPTRS